MTSCHPGLENSQPTGPKVAATAESTPWAPQRLADDLSGLHNVIEVSHDLFSGSEPEGEAGFASLAKLGVKTIVSVDGARPDVDAARRNGLRYIHIPIGYDGVPRPAAAALARAAREAEGPIYVHCHHGRHRGPAAAAVACVGAGKVQGKDALMILELAGTGKEYPGLWRDVEAYRPPSPDEKLPELVEVAKVDSLTEAMAGVDRHWDNLKLCRDAQWETPQNHPDLSPRQVALLLREAFHEANRTIPPEKFDGQFRNWLREVEDLAAEIETQLKASNLEEAGRQSIVLEKSCKKCHERYRN
jgi:protein tyrosine phosphatase (PTP) superfamily phosphohydrolase (DUF442 family)